MRYVLLIVMIAGCVIAQTISSPGIGGMNTVMDVDAMQPQQARYLLNTDVSSFPGMITRRLAVYPWLVTGDGGIQRLLSATTYYDDVFSRKLIWAGRRLDTISLSCYDSATFDDAADTAYFGGAVKFDTGLDTVLCEARRSVHVGYQTLTVFAFGSGLVERPYWNPTVYHDWLYFDDNTIHSSAGDYPQILTTKDVEWRANPDTGIFNPRVVPISIPAPGQLMARVLKYAAEDTLDDILADGSLEYWSSPDTLQYWDTIAGGNVHYYNYSTASEGDSALELQGEGTGTNDSGGVHQTVAIKPSASYRLTFDLHYLNRQTGYVVWEVRSNPGDSLIATDSTLTTTGDYVEKAINVTTLQFSKSATIRILLRGESYDDKKAYIDNIIFRRGTATPVVNSLYGDYEYTYQYGNHSDRDGGEEFGDTAMHSLIVSPRDQAVMVYGFLPSPFVLQDTTVGSDSKGHQKATHAFLFRRNVSQGPEAWEQVTDFWYDGSHIPMVIDSGQNDGWWNSSGLGPVTDTIPMPGQMIPNRADSTDTLTIHYETQPDSVWVRWSFYDPQIGMEGPMGPMTKGLIVDSNTTTDSLMPTLWSLGWLRERTTPTDWIRVYRTHSKADVLGEDDSTIWYCAYQFPIQQMSGDQEGTQVLLGMIPDSVLVLGTDFSLLDQDYSTYSDSATYLPYDPTNSDSTPFTSDNEAYDEYGHFIIRPPVVEQLQMFLSEMEYASFRLWGPGDPLYPARLYYSNYKAYWDWSAARYLDFDVGKHDEIVAIMKIEAGGQDLLYVFLHSSIYVLAGPDPEYSVEDYRITDKIGLIYRHAMIRVGNEIFFMARDGQIYSLLGAELNEEPLSAPIADRMLDFVTDTSGSDSYWKDNEVPGYVAYSVFPKDGLIHAYRMSNKVCWSNTETGIVLSFDLISRSWQEINFFNSTPLGSFVFDTIAAPLGVTKYDWFIYGDSACVYFEVPQGRDSTWSVAAGRIGKIPDWGYATFPIGDDEHIWQIRKININGIANAGTILRGYVLNRRGDTLATGDITFATGYDRYTMSFPPHSGNHLNVLLWSDSTLGTPGDTLLINSIQIHPRRIGRAPY